MKNKIDAVGMTRAIREAHHEALKDATPAERLRFYREKAQRLQEQHSDRARESTPARTPAA